MVLWVCVFIFWFVWMFNACVDFLNQFNFIEFEWVVKIARDYIKMGKSKKTSFAFALNNIFSYVNDNVKVINSSKLFAGFMIILLNISSKFITIKLSKTMESYLKYTFSRNVLVFVMAWMGSREIYVACIITFLFIICMDYLFNENSHFCVFPESFKEYHMNIEDNQPITEEDVKKAKEVLEKAKTQNLFNSYSSENKMGINLSSSY